MIISNLTFIIIICCVFFLAYVICSFTMSCDIQCRINYNKIENRNEKVIADQDLQNNLLFHQMMENPQKSQSYENFNQYTDSGIKIKKKKKSKHKHRKHSKETINDPVKNLSSMSKASGDDYIEQLIWQA